MLRNIPLRMKLLLMLVFPFMGFLVFSSVYVIDKYRTLTAMDRTVATSSTAQKLGGLVAALQRERGVTGVFLSSQGLSMRQQLMDYRSASDTAMAPIRALAADDSQDLSSVLRALDELGELRAQVDAMTLANGEFNLRYSRLISTLIGYSHSIEANIDDLQILRPLAALNQLTEMKERAGRERMLLGLAFSQDHFDAQLLSRFSSNLGEFTSYLSDYQRQVPASSRQKLDEILQHPDSLEVARLQRLAVEIPLGEALNYSPEDWLSLATRRIDRLGALEAELGRSIQALALQERDEAARDLWLTIGVTAFVLGMLLCLTYLIFNNIKLAVDDVNDTLKALSMRDLTARSQYQSGDEFGTIARNLNNMARQISEVIEEIGDAAAQVATAAEESSAVAMQTSQNLEHQRHGTDQVATAIHEMSATVRDVARSTTEAAEMSRQVNDSTVEGMHEIENTVRLVQTLSTQAELTSQIIVQLKQESDAISSVIDMIRGVADQTNLLALNAAIEAARAGEQGRGFAVVADEVRQLAQKTQQATVSIQQMIANLQGGADRATSSMKETLEKAQAGASNVVKAGERLVDIADGIANISDRNIQVASAAEEQSLVSEEINRNVNEINELVIQVSAGAEQTAVTSRELARLAEHQQQLVHRFKVA